MRLLEQGALGTLPQRRPLTDATPPATLRAMKKALTARRRWRLLAMLPPLLAVLACGLDLQPHPPPTRTPLVRLGPDSVQVLHGVPWGTLRLDGQSAATRGISLLPRIPHGTAPTFTLHSGQP